MGGAGIDATKQGQFVAAHVGIAGWHHRLDVGGVALEQFGQCGAFKRHWPEPSRG
ncbi:hypothetical protein D3C73_1609230 [compost metagenome]